MTSEDVSVGAQEHIIEAAKDRPALGVFERYLTLWVALCIVVGIALGHLLPAPFQVIGRLEVAQVRPVRKGLVGRTFAGRGYQASVLGRS